MMNIAKTVGRRGAIVASTLIVGTDLTAKPYELTALSVGGAALTTAIPAAIGLLGIRMKLPENFNVKDRERLAETSAHISNVNGEMDRHKIPLTHYSAGLILLQEALKHTPGDNPDNVLERSIAGSFYKAYSESIPSADSLAKMSPEELAQLRKERTFDAVGAGMHTTYSAIKQFKYNLLNPELNKYNQHDAHEANDTKRDAHYEEMKDILAPVPSPNFTDLLRNSVSNANTLEETVETVKANCNAYKARFLKEMTKIREKDLNPPTTNTPDPDTTTKKFHP